MIITENGLKRELKSKKRRMFCLNDGNRNINELTGGVLPKDAVFKFISLAGGFASVNFIKFVALKEPILELTASTLRVGEKQFNYLSRLKEGGKLGKATFFIGSIMREDSKTSYDYFTKFQEVCEKCEWEFYVTNNHSKIILMRTEKNYFVLESSSNLNENPKIEQYSFENSKELYDFYYDFFNLLKGADKNGQSNKIRGASRREKT